MLWSRFTKFSRRFTPADLCVAHLGCLHTLPSSQLGPGDQTTMNRSVRDARSLYVSGIGGIAFFIGFAPFVDLVFSVYDLLFVIAAMLGAMFLIIARVRQGRPSAFILLELAVIGLFVFIPVYGAMWYFL